MDVVASTGEHALPVAVLPDGSSVELQLSWAGYGYPRDVVRALQPVEPGNASAGSPQLIICAQSISDGSRKLLESLGVSWFALDGSASLHIGTVWVEREARAAAVAEELGFRWTAARADIAEVLMSIVVNGAAWPDGRPRVADVETLGRLAGRSLGSVANALSDFDVSEWTEPGPEPRSRALRDPRGLLDSWSGWDRRQRRRWDTFHTLSRNPDEIASGLLDVFRGDLILTGAAVSERSRPMLTGSRTVAAYVRGDWRSISAAAIESRMMPAAEGMIRLAVAPPSVTNTARIIDGLPVASPVRVYADLLAGSERERDAAEVYRAAELGPLA